MSVAVGADGYTAGSRRLAIEPLRGALLWLMGFAGGFVFIEPSPYEFIGFATIFLFGLTGLSLRPALAPLILLLMLLNAGYAVALMQVIDDTSAVIWVLVSAFLAISAIFFAAVLGTNTEARLNWLLRGYVAAAVIVSLVAIAAYFHLFGSWSDAFMLYERARGTFKDPNVFGAFLVLPGLLAFERVLGGRLRAVIASGALLLVMLAALLLTFSRGAWGQFLFAALLMMGMNFLTSRSANARARIALIAMLGTLVLVVFVVALLSIDKVAELFYARASLEQDYDVGHYGRFGRYILGAGLALDNPFGIGPLQFPHFLPEAPHNVYLNAFMSGGWLGGFSYFTLTAVTVVMGMRYAFVATPWRATYHAVYAAYVGMVVESLVIDSDHWRHYFLICGVLWGLMSVTRAQLAHRRANPHVELGTRALARPAAST